MMIREQCWRYEVLESLSSQIITPKFRACDEGVIVYTMEPDFVHSIWGICFVWEFWVNRSTATKGACTMSIKPVSKSIQAAVAPQAGRASVVAEWSSAPGPDSSAGIVRKPECGFDSR